MDRRIGNALTATAWWRNEEWDGPSFTWDLWYGCNYRCSYCWWEMDDLWGKLAATHKLLPPENWIEVWDRIGQRYGETRLDVIGGEPMRYPKAVELFGGLARKHRVSITTNLSSPLAELRALTDLAGPERLHLAASYHPQFAVHDDFAGKIRFLKDRG